MGPQVWERLDPAADGVAWPSARTDHAAVAAGGRLWVMGGQDPIGRAEAGCESQYLPFDAVRDSACERAGRGRL